MKKCLSIILFICIFVCSIITNIGNFYAAGTETVLGESTDQTYLEDLPSVESDRYIGNQGDSFIGKIGTRTGNRGADGITYDHGLEIWIARWNFKDESSWAWAKYEIPKGMKYISGTLTYLLDSYNKSDFETVFEVYGDETLIYSQDISQENKKGISICVSIEGYSTIMIKMQDIKSVKGGTAFCFGNACFSKSKNNNSVTDEEFDFGNDNNQTNGDYSYGVVTNKKTSQEKVYDDAESFYKALNQYIEAFKSSAQTDTKSKVGGRSAMAKKLQEVDAKTNDKIITPDPGATKESLQCVYETLADYLEEYTQEGIEIGKIDLKQDYITISAGIVNKIRNKMGSEALEFTRTFKNYTVTFYVARNFGTNFGRIEVTGIHPWIADGVIKSSAKDTAEILTNYVNNLSDMVKDLSKQALKSVLTDFADSTTIASFTKGELENIFKGKEELLRSQGYGNILKNMIKLRDSYDVINDIISASKKGDDLKVVLQDAKKIYDKIKKFDYSDSSVDKAALQSAMNMLEQAKKKLGDSLFNYIYNTGNSEEGGFWNKKVYLQCPVDFTVYDVKNNVLGYVKDGSVYYDNKIRIEISGDVKALFIPDNLAVHLSMEGTGDGEMNYMIEEIKDGKIIGRQNYYGIPLEQGKKYSQQISSDSLSEDARSFPIHLSDGAVIYANEYISASDKTAHILVSCSTETGGRIIGDGSYAKGSPVELLALPEDDTYEFKGWYIGDNVVEIGGVYRFTALENVNVRASFAKKTEQDSGYETILGEDYDEFAWVHIYKTGTDSKNVALRMLGLDALDKCKTVTVKKYTASGSLMNETSLKTDYDNASTFWLHGMGLESAKTEIYDMSGKLIVAIYNNTDISPENLITNILLTMKTVDLKDGATVQMAASITPSDAVNKTLSWTSDNPSVATVDQNGLVTAVAPGKATITVSSTDGSNVSASCVITVTKSGSVTQPGGDNSSGGNSSGGSSSSGGSTGDIPSGDSISNNNSNSSDNKPDTSVQIKLLYYIVEFNANAGTELSRKTMTLLNDDNLGILPKVQRKNYSFKGWYTQKSGGTKVNSDTVLNAGTTLFAQWQKVKKPSKVKVLSLKSSKKGRLVVRFQKAGKADGYEIFYSTDKKFPSSLTKKTVTASAKKTLQKLKSGKKYYVRIRAYKLDSAGKKVYGKYSKVETVRVK